VRAGQLAKYGSIDRLEKANLYSGKGEDLSVEL